MRRLWAIIPVVLFVGLAGLGVWGVLGQRAEKFESQLIGKPAPAITARLLGGEGELALEAYRGKPIVLNFWASWCVPCRVEHPVLLQLSKDDRIVVLGLAYRDEPEDARRFLAELGDPFAASGLDPLGESGIEFGITGVPETFLIGADGTVLAKHTGPLAPDEVAAFLAPALNAASTAR
jgi:cytochrome c biogenesis protein CcmG/thiol:disulfide interchange protein DsbE